VLNYQDRLLVAKENTVFVSAPYGDVYNIDAKALSPLRGCSLFYSFANFQIVDPCGGAITGMACVGSQALILTPRTTWIVNGIDTWTGPSSCRCIDPNVGCAASRTLKATKDAAFFVGTSGVYVNDGMTNVCISEQSIPKTFDGLNKFALDGAVAEVYHAKKQYRLWVPDGDNRRNNVGLVYHFERKAWTKFGLPRFLERLGYWGKYEVACLLSARDEQWSEELISIDYDGTIYWDDYGCIDVLNDASYAIPTILVTTPIHSRDQTYIVLRHLRSSVKTDGDSSVRTGALLNGSAWEQIGLADDGETEEFAPNDDDQADKYSLLDERLTVADQCYSDIYTPLWLPLVRRTAGEGTTGDPALTVAQPEENYPSTDFAVTVRRGISQITHQPYCIVQVVGGSVSFSTINFMVTLDLGEYSDEYTGIVVTMPTVGEYSDGDSWTFHVGPVLIDGSKIGSSRWTEKRVQERHSDFAHGSRNARILMHSGTEIVESDTDHAMVARVAKMVLFGFEVEVIPKDQKRCDD
jgi:hypothetical protein